MCGEMYRTLTQVFRKENDTYVVRYERDFIPLRTHSVYNVSPEQDSIIDNKPIRIWMQLTNC